jgi:hypothetical protein
MLPTTGLSSISNEKLQQANPWVCGLLQYWRTLLPPSSRSLALMLEMEVPQNVGSHLPNYVVSLGSK